VAKIRLSSTGILTVEFVWLKLGLS
jgi:hypothetical protein